MSERTLRSLRHEEGKNAVMIICPRAIRASCYFKYYVLNVPSMRQFPSYDVDEVLLQVEAA